MAYPDALPTDLDSTLVSGGQVGARGDDVAAESSRPGFQELRPGLVLAGRYRLRERIGVGGMGEVYSATHEVLGTEVAVKVVRGKLRRQTDVLQRFWREARILAALQSPHVVRIVDAGRTRGGLSYLVEERLRGMDLRRWLRERGPQPVRTAVEWTLQVCDALSEASEHSIVHRDVKPANVFLADVRGRGPCVKLLDFGVARVGEDAGLVTAPRASLGSLRYVSPEQMLDPTAVDARADVWGVGLLLFEMLTGHSPFDGMAVGEIVARLRGSEELPLSFGLRRDVPPWLDRLVRRCLELDRRQRPRSAGQVALALSRLGVPSPA